ncbi:hypothetical protein QQP08_001046 [Theobroma cacao]|nr:hypothetical protein QQP08_001046 [Theobroma cacao]
MKVMMSEIHLCSFGFGKDLINAFANMQNLCIHMVIQFKFQTVDSYLSGVDTHASEGFWSSKFQHTRNFFFSFPFYPDCQVLSQIEKGKGLWKTVPFIVYCVSVKSYHAHHHFSYLLPLGPKVKAVASVMQQALVWSLGFD